MAKRSGALRGRLAQQMPAMKGKLIVRISRGVEIAQKWPRRRGRRLHPKVASQNQWFRDATYATRYVDPEQKKIAMEVTAGSPILPRDFLLAAMAGRLYELVGDDGEVFVSMAQTKDVSQDLDIIARQVGNILVRGPELWQPLSPGPAGHFLRSKGGLQVPEWAAPTIETLPVSRVEASSSQALPPATETKLVFGTLVRDDAAAWDAANNRWVIPAGVEAVTITVNANTASSGTTARQALFVRLNGATVANQTEHAGGFFRLSVSTGALIVQQGDIIEALAFAGTARTLAGDQRTNMSLIVLS